MARVEPEVKEKVIQNGNISAPPGFANVVKKKVEEPTDKAGILAKKLGEIYPNKPSVVIRMRIAKHKREQGAVFESTEIEDHIKYFCSEFDIEFAAEVTLADAK